VISDPIAAKDRQSRAGIMKNKFLSLVADGVSRVSMLGAMVIHRWIQIQYLAVCSRIIITDNIIACSDVRS